jgi:hypothetical protein
LRARGAQHNKNSGGGKKLPARGRKCGGGGATKKIYHEEGIAAQLPLGLPLQKKNKENESLLLDRYDVYDVYDV